MAIFRNIVVDVPDGAYVGKDAAVFVKDLNEYDPVKKYNRVKHTIIGKSISNGQMYPNHNFKLRYPSAFEAASGEKLPKQTKKIGFYTMVLSLAEKTGLYDVLIKSYGIENANMILDFSMYSIIHHTCVAEQYPSAMEDQLLFSSNLWSSSKLSKFFNNEVSEERTYSFRKIWAAKCKERGITEAWLAIDGSNNDCTAQKAEIAEPGNAKSHKNINIVSYMYAVDSRNGDPITFSIYRGGRVDCKAVIEMIGWLKAYDIRVKGVIVDRGFATKEVLELFEQNQIAYVAMLKSDAKAHTVMLERYAEKIRMQYEYMLGSYHTKKDVETVKEFADKVEILYGTEEKEKVILFSAHKYSAYVSLIYDRNNGGERQETWFKKVSNTALKIQRKLDSGMSASVPPEYADCMEIKESNGKPCVFVNEARVQEKGNRKGFYSLATSQPLTAAEANDIYTLRNSSEEQFSMVKSQLGYDTARTHFTEGIKAKLTLAFIAAIVRNELVKACKIAALSTNRMVNELNQVCMYMGSNGEYFVCHTENQRQISLMNSCGVIPQDLDRIAEAENKRMSCIEPNPFHKYPDHVEDESITHRRPGRPKGSKNQIPKTENEGNSADGLKQKRKPGRPKGSKNKKTLESQDSEQKEKRGPGRPKGSKNKPKSEIEPEKRTRGRPRKDSKD